MAKVLVALLIGLTLGVGTSVAFAGGTGPGGSCKKNSDCQKGMSCQMDKQKGHKTCQ